MERRITTGIGLASLLILVSACGAGRTASEEVIRRWADAATEGDYAASKALMGMDPFMEEMWQTMNEPFRVKGRLQAYTIVDGPSRVGQSTNAMLRWTGSEAPLCLRVQVSPDGKLFVLSNYEQCEE